MYEVILKFSERYDDGHIYSVGDTYPQEGFSPPQGRVEELLDGTNRARKVYLKAICGLEKKPAAEKPKPRKKKE